MQLMEHEAPGVGRLRYPAPMHACCILKALFTCMNESRLIVRYKQKLFMVGTRLMCRMFVIILFLALRRLVPVFKALFMARL